MAKFIIVDQSLVGCEGHHLEYDLSVAQAARDAGWTAIVLGNRRMGRRWSTAGVTFIPAFRRTWYESLDGTRAVAGLDLGKRVARFFGAAYLWLVTCLAFLACGRRRMRPIASGFLRDFENLPAAVRGVWEGMSRLRRKVVGEAGLPNGVKAALALLKGRVAFDDYRPRATFRQDLERMLRRTGAGPGDLVFVHTLSAAELQQLLDLFAANDVASLPRFHLLLRRSPSEPVGGLYDVLPLATCLEQMHDGGYWPHLVRFYTDTDHLTREHDCLSPVRFETLPIPFRHELIDRHLQARQQQASAPLTVVYLGQARTEKGYQHLPLAVRSLWHSHIRNGRLRFVIQSNYNLAEGEPGMPAARRALEQYPERYVTVIREGLEPDDYYRLLASADIVVIPYDAVLYRNRSSGIFAEALAAGKPVVVPDNTWMSDELPAGAGLAFRDTDDIGRCIAAIADDYPAFQQAAGNAGKTWRDLHNPASLVSRLLESHAECRPAEVVRPTVLLMLNCVGHKAFTTGSGMIQRAQADYLRRCGYRVFAALINMENCILPIGYRQVERNLVASAAGAGFAATWVLTCEHRWTRVATVLRVLKAFRSDRDAEKRGIDGLKLALAWRRMLGIPEPMSLACRRRRVDAVLVNYVDNLPVAGLAGLPRSIPVICEMHDIMAHQRAIAADRDVDLREYAAECRLLDECRVVLPVSRFDGEKIEPRVSRATRVHVPRLVNAPPVTYAAMAGCRTVSEILAAGGSNHPLLQPNAPMDAEAVRRLRELDKTDRLNLLYVSSRHGPNIHSLAWFLQNVFVPFLAPRGLNLVIAGPVSSVIREGTPQVIVAGELEDLAPLYAAAEIVILPIVSGGGTNIKALEAIALQKPLVATSMAMRGVDLDFGQFRFHDAADEFGKEILRLIGDRDARARLRGQVADLYDPRTRAAAYDEAMTAAFTHCLGDQTLKPRQRALFVRRGPAGLVEWSPAVKAFNGAMRNFIGGLQVAAPQARLIAEATDMDGAFEEMYEALLIYRSAPILERLPWVAQAVAQLAAPPSFREFLAMCAEAACGAENPIPKGG